MGSSVEKISERKICVVVTNVSKDVSLRAAEWTLSNFLVRGDSLTLLVVGGESRNQNGVDQGQSSNGIFHSKSELEAFSAEFHSSCKSKQVLFQVQVKEGPLESVILEEVNALRASLVTLDRNLQGLDLKLIQGSLSCKVYLMTIDEGGSFMRKHMDVHDIGSSEEDAETFSLDLDSSYYAIDMNPSSSQEVSCGSAPSDYLPFLYLPVDAFATPVDLQRFSSRSDLSVVESPMSIPISFGGSQKSTSVGSSFSLPRISPVRSVASSSLSNTNSVRSPMPRSISDLYFKMHKVATSVDGSVSLGIQPRKPVTKPWFSIGPVKSRKSLNVHRESERLDEDYTIPETDVYRGRLMYDPCIQAYMEAPLQQQRILSWVEKPVSMTESSLCNSLCQGGQTLLCSGCKQMSPLRRSTRRFSYVELQVATNNFSESNFLGEGRFGFVYKGELNGQKIAVKQHKLASSQGYKEFQTDVDLLSWAQHRNLVMLLGCCDEDGHRMLVYEYVCNKSLDWHLSSMKNPKGLVWPTRLKVAIGAARALRYLHEECRVGCIIHRDMRPKNILLTHDYEPMVGDFGLARSHLEGEGSIKSVVIGTFGYLAPEYVESRQASWRADVYAFGVVLMELITGRKAIDLLRPPGEQSLTEWARPRLADEAMLVDLVDDRLESFHMGEMRAMVRAASLCISKDPTSRPPMSQVLHILEGEFKGLESSRQMSGLIARQTLDSSHNVTASKAFEYQTSNIGHQKYSRISFHKSHRTWKQKYSNSRKPKLLYEDML